MTPDFRFGAFRRAAGSFGGKTNANPVSGARAMLYDGPDFGGTGGPMDVSEFEELIDRLGEDLSLWPDDRRGLAEELLARSSAAQALLEEARAVRQALAAPPVRAPAGLADRIVAAAAKLKGDTAEPRTEGETAES